MKKAPILKFRLLNPEGIKLTGHKTLEAAMKEARRVLRVWPKLKAVEIEEFKDHADQGTGDWCHVRGLWRDEVVGV